jgi:hypothetical protein
VRFSYADAVKGLFDCIELIQIAQRRQRSARVRFVRNRATDANVLLLMIPKKADVAVVKMSQWRARAVTVLREKVTWRGYRNDGGS